MAKGIHRPELSVFLWTGDGPCSTNLSRSSNRRAHRRSPSWWRCGNGARAGRARHGTESAQDAAGMEGRRDACPAPSSPLTSWLEGRPWRLMRHQCLSGAVKAQAPGIGKRRGDERAWCCKIAAKTLKWRASATLGLRNPLISLWCREWDSNPHTLRRRILNPLRLPIPPSRLGSRALSTNTARRGKQDTQGMPTGRACFHPPDSIHLITCSSR